jgi:tetratricopeptide (TPR) repeat protein
MRRFIVPGLPFVLSLTLSAFTIGAHVGWQDSGFYLAGVKELGILYPPGFPLYLLLCKVWTLLLGFVDFTLAVHLFSAFCVAVTCGILAVAARDLLRSTGPIFHVVRQEHDAAATAAGGLAATGFSLWSAALLAKGYAFYYLILALLIWRMIRADESRRPRDFTVVAVLIGLSWAAHPSAVGIGVALVLFVVFHRRTLGAKGIAARAGLAAAAAIGPSLLLPLFASRDPQVMFGDPAFGVEWVRYLTGSRFIGMQDVFGADAFRFGHTALYLWEDFLGVGAVCALAGLSRLATLNRPLLLGVAAWVVPSALLATLFRIEGQQDFWLVASWLPLHLAVAIGLASIPARLARFGVPGLAAAGLLWAIAVNGRPVSMRDETLAEEYGRYHLLNVEKEAVLILDSDDTLATVEYLQVVRGLRPDVAIASASRFGSPWYEEHLRRRHPRLKPGATIRAFAEANAAAWPVYFENVPPDLAAARTDLVPAGPLLRLGPPGSPKPDPWVFPVRVEDVRARFGRERGIRLVVRSSGLDVLPEPYEQRWISAYVRAEANQGQVHLARGGEENLKKAAEFFGRAMAADPSNPDRGVVHGLAVCYYLLRQFDRAEPLLKQLLRLDPTPRQAVRACSFLSTICRSQGRSQEALRYQDQAMAIVGSDPELRREFERQSPR